MIIKQEKTMSDLNINFKDGIVNYGDSSQVEMLFDKAKKGGHYTVGFLGRSITMGSGASDPSLCYAKRVFDWFCNTFCHSDFSYVNAGIGATDSQFACARVEDDLLCFKPDIVFLEFSVNDENTPHFKETYEGLVRRILSAKKKPALVLVHNMFYEDGHSAEEIHSSIGRRYNLPCISIKNTLFMAYSLENKDWKPYSKDGLHPSDEGHRLVAGIIAEGLKELASGRQEEINADRALEENLLPIPETPNEYENSVRIQPRKLTEIQENHPGLFKVTEIKGFTEDLEEQRDITDIFKNGWKATDTGASFEFDIKASCIGLQYRRTVKRPAQKALVVIDGDTKNPLVLDTAFDETWGDKLCLTTVLEHGRYAVHHISIMLTDAPKDAPLPFYLVSVIASGKEEESLFTVDGNLLKSEKKIPAVCKGFKEDNVSEAMCCDSVAEPAVKRLYSYLKNTAKSENIIFGHQNDAWDKAGQTGLLGNAFSLSDTEDITGSITGIVGMDALALTGMEFSVERYNNELCPKYAYERIDIGKYGRKKANVLAAARLADHIMEKGGIVTLSAHMPNFAFVKEDPYYDSKKDPLYARYDFTGYSPNRLEGDTMNRILPGEDLNEVYRAYLDMMVDFLKEVHGPVVFRPFHENTGSWFWWGQAFCSDERFKKVFRYTCEYMKESGLHNLLYAYSPSNENRTADEYAMRYPGDDIVDIVGIDTYERTQDFSDKEWFAEFRKQLDALSDFAKIHGKIMALTETGLAANADKNDLQTAVHRNENQVKNWYCRMLEVLSDYRCAYFLLWADFSVNNGFYIPYVREYTADGKMVGHEYLEDFINFAMNEKVILAKEQKGYLKNKVKN